MGDFLKDGVLVMEQRIKMGWSDALVVGFTLAISIFLGVVAAQLAKKLL